MQDKLEIYLKNCDLTEPQELACTDTGSVYKVKHKSNTFILKLLNEQGQKYEQHGVHALSVFEATAPKIIRYFFKNS